ncbi:hypothetical protein NDU88_002776 [Pleurodeles waltl]|uniref:Uncharacterized protein n=1 Tax=Pleurodeles waltl TaxID=8319 RepID=A0AAV7RD15_PLEWA|nr:hypothetical protein NDU88_002776 [Pleurodeles waltl]
MRRVKLEQNAPQLVAKAPPRGGVQDLLKAEKAKAESATRADFRENTEDCEAVKVGTEPSERSGCLLVFLTSECGGPAAPARPSHPGPTTCGQPVTDVCGGQQLSGATKCRLAVAIEKQEVETKLNTSFKEASEKAP